LNARIPTRGFVIALSSAILALPTFALADAGNGGTAPPAPGATAPFDPSFELSAKHNVFLGKALRIAGSVPDAAGKTVQVQARTGDGAWLAVASTPADASGAFSTTWKPSGAGQYELRGVIAGATTASEAGSASAPRTVTVYKPARATWYGPGFYGRKTACGMRLTRTLVGVAHRRLPCGTQVSVSYRGRSIVAPVVDRGPFAHNAQWDLTAAAAKQLGMTVTSRIGAAPIDQPVQPPAL
jgi:peptidoglycan lytic transglycosylase